MNSGDKPRLTPERRRATVIELPTGEPPNLAYLQHEYQAGDKRRRSGNTAQLQLMPSHSPLDRDGQNPRQPLKKLSGKVKKLERSSIGRSNGRLQLESSSSLGGGSSSSRGNNTLRAAAPASSRTYEPDFSPNRIYGSMRNPCPTVTNFANDAKAEAARVANEIRGAEGALEIVSDHSSDDGCDDTKSDKRRSGAPKASAQQPATTAIPQGEPPASADSIEIVASSEDIGSTQKQGPEAKGQHSSSDGSNAIQVADAPSPTKATRVRPDQKGAEPQNVDRLGMADSVARKISGFDASYSDNTPRLQSLIRNTDAVSQGASANSIAHLLKPSGNPAKSTKHVVDRLKPRHRDRDLGAQSAQPDGRSPPLASPTKAASRSATAATTPTSSKYFSSSKSRVQAAEEYDEALVVVSPKRSARSTRRTTLATPVDLRSPSPPPRSVTAPNSDTKRPYKRRSSITPRPPASTLPNKSIELRGIQIGKYVQLAKLDVRLAPSAMLKLNVHPLQRNMEITGLHDGYEFMKIDINDIDTLEYMSVDKVAVMCITPKNTVESVFEEAMFDPSSSSADLKLMYLCWELQNKSIADIIPRFAAAFEQVFSSGELDLEIYEKYAQELSQPGSVDLISSSDDESRINSKGRNAQKGLADSSMDEAVLSSGVVKKQYTAKPQPPKADTSKSGKPGAFSYWSSIDNLPSTTTKPREDPWGVRNISGRQQALGTSLGGSATCAGQKRYSLRNATNVSIAEPPSESDDDDDFVSQKRVFGFTDHTIRFEYPPGDRKSITVTGSDISRLYRSEFLNDTVIEFYLRYISENLRARDPKLYEQCFFFNTFFFKKLSQRHKGAAAGSNDEIIEAVYSQLKKWTANADLFSKKYIFVPINENIHWYLAIITNPDLLLSKNSESSDHKDSASAAAPDGDGNGNGNGDGMTAADVDAKDSQESRHTLSDYFAVKSADTLSNGKPDDEPTQPTCQATKDIDGDIEMPDASEIICPAKDDCALAAKAAPQTTSLPVYKRSSSLDSAKQHSPEVVIDLSAPAHPKTVTLIFRGKEVQVPETKYQDPTSSPSIVILDSLGNKHPSTFGLLRGYIQSEAKHKHKRHVEHSPLGKYAKVPLQNNLCDCGVFVLHYVEEFLSDPLTFMTMALNGVSMREWFVPGLVKQKRKDILSLATRLAEEHTASLKESKKSADLSPSADSLSAKAEDQQTLEPTKDSSKSDDANMAEAARVGSEPENKS